MRYPKHWIAAVIAGALILTFFAMLEKSVEANMNIQFNAADHAGKFVEMGGRKWVVMNVIDGKPYVMMDSIYAEKAWNSSGDSSDASEIFQYLQDEFNSIIPVAEDRELIAETTWEIRSMQFDSYYIEHMTAGGKTISPSSVTQKLGLVSMKDFNDYCKHFRVVLDDSIWTRTPFYDRFNPNDPNKKSVYIIWASSNSCAGTHHNPNSSSIGVQPVLYLKDSVRIKGGLGTKEDPYVLSVSDDPVAGNIEADGTTNTVSVENVLANTMVNVYASNGTTQIGSQTNRDSTGIVNVKVSADLRWNDTVYVTFTQPSKGESNKVAATVQDNDPPIIELNSPSGPMNKNVTVTATITDKGSVIAEKKWAKGEREVAFFRASGQWNSFSGNTFEVEENGIYTVYAKDAAGNDGVKQITISNIDRTPPTLSNVSIKSSNANEKWAKVGDIIVLSFESSKELGTQSSATIAGNAVTIENTEGLKYQATYTLRDTDPEGTIAFSINYKDRARNAGIPVTSTSDNSQVKFDRTAPTIQFSPNGNTYPAKTATSSVVVTDEGSGVDSNTLQYAWTKSENKPTSGWQSFDNEETELKFEDSSANGDVYLHILAKDNAGNERYLVSEAFVLDNTPPVITLNGDSEITIEAGSSFIDPGAVATDNMDGDVSGFITKTGTVDTQIVGTYTITYQVTDRADNTTTATRTVIVEPAEPPVIEFAPNGNINPAKIAESTVTVTDEGSGVDEDSLEYVWSESQEEQSDGWQPFINGAELNLDGEHASGNWYLHVRARDKARNESYGVSKAFVLDNTPPVITLIGENPLTVEAGTTFTDPGATAIDNHDGDLTESIVVNGTVNPLTLGEYLLTYDVSDSTGNMTTVTRTVFVQDTQPPTLELLGETEITLRYGATFEDPGATAYDDFYGDLTEFIEVTGTIDTMSPGTYTLRYNVQDPSGNSAEEQIRIVHVQNKRRSSGGSSGGGGFIPPTDPKENDDLNIKTPSIEVNGKAIDIDTSTSPAVIEVIPSDIDSEVKVAYVTIPLSIMADIANENPHFQMEMKAPYGSYVLPVTLPSLVLGWEELLEENGWQTDEISFKLTLTDMTEDEAIENALAEQLPNGRSIGAIVDFDLALVDATTGEVLAEINEFTQPLIRMIPITEEPDSELWGAFRSDETSGEFTFVPAHMEKRNDESFAVLRSYSNSIYLVAENEVRFSDTEQHWGEEAIAQAAAKGLVRGKGDGLFAPNSFVSRAEFAAMLVRALGRDSSTLHDLSYVDVQPGAWYIGEVAQAEKLGLLDFIEDNRLKPNQPLTREEMASMLASAVRLEMQFLPEEMISLNRYRDKEAMDEAYVEDIELIVTLGIMKGTGTDQFSAKGETTRAQAVTVLLRTLGTLGWID